MTEFSSSQTIDLVAGARPNFMKIAPVERALRISRRFRTRIVHTGQHYDQCMNEVFFSDLGIPKPDVDLNVGSGSHGAQAARIIERYEAHLLEKRPAATVVFGDVNSTVACALAAVKLGIPVVHVEAGLRSYDRAMPEEINRILTDAMSSLLLISEPSGVRNLQREGIENARVKLVGNVMIDTLMLEQPKARALKMAQRLGLTAKEYGLVTLHRPANVDDPIVLKKLLELLGSLARRLPLVFPMHPRTKAAIERAQLSSVLCKYKDVMVLGPLPYRENLSLMTEARLVLTDSGGMQEESTMLDIPCLTLRDSTERPVTLEYGTSRLVGSDESSITVAFEDARLGRWPHARPIAFWDGQAGKRVARAIEEFLTGC